MSNDQIAREITSCRLSLIDMDHGCWPMFMYSVMAPWREERRPMARCALAVSVAVLIFIISTVTTTAAGATRTSDRRGWRLGTLRPTHASTTDWARACSL